MAKNIVKQIIITLLLCLAIILILAVLLYAYVPNNKIIPEQVSYAVPEDVEEVLKDSIAEDSQVILTYEIQASDLKNAERTNNYNPGKVNPFSSYKTEESTTSQSGTTTNSSSTTSGTTTNNSISTSTDQGSYFTDTGTK